MGRQDIRWWATVMTATLFIFGDAARGDGVGERIEWQTDSGRVQLVATAMAITAHQKIFTARDAVVTVHGDPGDGLYWTLEAEWFENGVRMRLFIYFESDGTDWWASSIRTYDGTDDGAWVIHDGEFFRSPLGEPFAGNLDLKDADSGCSLRMANLRIETTP